MKKIVHRQIGAQHKHLREGEGGRRRTVPKYAWNTWECTMLAHLEKNTDWIRGDMRPLDFVGIRTWEDSDHVGEIFARNTNGRARVGERGGLSEVLATSFKTFGMGQVRRRGRSRCPSHIQRPAAVERLSKRSRTDLS